MDTLRILEYSLSIEKIIKEQMKGFIGDIKVTPGEEEGVVNIDMMYRPIMPFIRGTFTVVGDITA